MHNRSYKLDIENIILRKYQAFAKDTINPIFNSTRKLIKYDTGVGKTITSLVIAMMYISLVQSKFDDEDESFKYNIFIIGHTEDIFVRELLKYPEFGFITNNEKEVLETTIDKDQYNELFNTYKKRIINRYKNGVFIFMGYTSFQHNMFPNGKINEVFLSKCENAMLIIDEAQSIYNSESNNTWGDTIMAVVNKYPDIILLLLSATPINSYPTEVVRLINLLNTDSVTENDVFTFKKNELGDMVIKDVNIALIQEKFMGKVLFIKNSDISHFARKEFIGSSIRNIDYLKFIRCEMPAIQYKAYKLSKKHLLDEEKLNLNRSLKKEYEHKQQELQNSDSIDINIDTDIDRHTFDTYMVNDIVFPFDNEDGVLYQTKDFYKLKNAKKYGIEIIDKKITGSFFKKENLQLYSAKKYKMIIDILNLCHDRINGKGVIYNGRVGNGIFIDAEILSQNGFVEYGMHPSTDTLCSICGVTNKNHIKINKSVIESTNKNKFNPIFSSSFADKKIKSSSLFSKESIEELLDEKDNKNTGSTNNKNTDSTNNIYINNSIKNALHENNMLRLGGSKQKKESSVLKRFNLEPSVSNNIPTYEIKNDIFVIHDDKISSSICKFEIESQNILVTKIYDYMLFGNNFEQIVNYFEPIFNKHYFLIPTDALNDRTYYFLINKNLIKNHNKGCVVANHFNIRKNRLKTRAKIGGGHKSKPYINLREVSKIHDFKPLSYMLLYGSLDYNQKNQILNIYNRVENTYGDECKFIIGSKMIEESVNFMAVKHLFIQSKPSNISSLIQLFGRAVRDQSHKYLSDSERVVKIYIYVSSIPGFGDISNEELKYKENIDNYKKIQIIEKAINSVAVDSYEYEDLIKKSLLKTPGIGPLMFKPTFKDPEFIKNYNRFKHIISYDRKIELCKYIIETLFKDKCKVINIMNIIKIIKSDLFTIDYAGKEICEDTILFSIHLIVNTLNNSIITKDDVAGILKIYKNGMVKTNYFLNDSEQIKPKSLPTNNYEVIDKNENILKNYHKLYSDLFIVFEPYKHNIIKEKDFIKLNDTEEFKHTSLIIDMPYRQNQIHDSYIYNINSIMDNFNNDYESQKNIMINKNKEIGIQEIIQDLSIYNDDFNNKFIDDVIMYVYKFWTSKNMDVILHTFYMKMLYVYDSLGVIAWGDMLGTAFNNKYMSVYSKFIGNDDIQKDIISDHSLIGIKTYRTNIISKFPRINKYSYDWYNSKFTKVSSAFLPIGHLYDSTPKIIVNNEYKYVNDLINKVSYIENDIIIGYTQKKIKSFELEFKLREPSHTLIKYSDFRLNKKGSNCFSYPKDQLEQKCKSLNVDTSDGKINVICNELYEKLIELEKKERVANTNIKYFYHFWELM